MTSSTVEFLGQAGFRIPWSRTTVYLDPYLSDSVQALDAPDLVRQVPAPVRPHELDDADWVLITHEHIDHCDPHTLPELAKASPSARFFGPVPALARLKEWGIREDRLELATEQWTKICSDLKVRAVPAAHPRIERDAEGRLACVGYVVEGPGGERAYFAGDTAVCTELLTTLTSLAPMRLACVPVNEQNFFRERRGIIGNMTVREAFLLAQEIGATRVFPYHWDMFAANSAYPEEIQLIHSKMAPEIELVSAPFELFPEA